MLGVLYVKSHRRPEERKHRSGKKNNGEGGHEKGDQEGDLMAPRQRWSNRLVDCQDKLRLRAGQLGCGGRIAMRSQLSYWCSYDDIEGSV